MSHETTEEIGISDAEWMVTCRKLGDTQVQFQHHAIESLRRGEVQWAMAFQQRADALRFCTGPYCPMPSTTEPADTKTRLLPVRIVRTKRSEASKSDT